MTPNQAKKIVSDALAAHGFLEGLAYEKLTAKTVSFADLARASCIFVKIHGWKPHPAYDDVAKIARANGFRIE